MAEAALALEKSERRFRALIEMATDLVAIGDTKGKMTYVSPSVESIAGYKPGETLGRDFLEFVHPDDRKTATAHLAELLRHPENILSSELRYRHATGHWLTLQTSSRNLLDDPAVAGIVVRARGNPGQRRAESGAGSKDRHPPRQQGRIPAVEGLHGRVGRVNHWIVESALAGGGRPEIRGLVIKSGMWRGVW